MITRKTWREIRLLVCLYVFLLEAGIVISILMWPWLRDEAPTLAKMVPADFIKRWVEGVTDQNTAAAYCAYMALQLFFKGVNVVGVCFAVVFGALLIARERETQTLEFLLSRPISRSRVLFEKSAVMIAGLVAPIILTSWSAIPLSWIVGENLPWAGVTIGAAYSALFCIAFLAIASACSVLFRTQIHVIALVGGFAVLEVGIYFVQEIRAISLFRLSDFDVYSPILAGNLGVGHLFATRGVWLVGATLLAYLTADHALRRAEL